MCFLRFPNRIGSQIRGPVVAVKVSTEPDEDLDNKFEARIKAYEAKIAEATPPDKRAKEIEAKLTSCEAVAKQKKLSAEKNRKEAERVSALADQEDEDATARSRRASPSRNSSMTYVVSWVPSCTSKERRLSTCRRRLSSRPSPMNLAPTKFGPRWQNWNFRWPIIQMGWPTTLLK